MEQASLGVTCLDCHANGHTNAAFHLVRDIRPQAQRFRIDTLSLRGVQPADPRLEAGAASRSRTSPSSSSARPTSTATRSPRTKKGVNLLDRGQPGAAHGADAEHVRLPAGAEARSFGKLDPSKATEQELLGEQVFYGKGRAANATPPYYIDNMMHDLKVERFYKPEMINDQLNTAEGPIKTFTLRGIKDSPPYLHDGRLLTWTIRWSSSTWCWASSSILTRRRRSPRTCTPSNPPLRKAFAPDRAGVNASS